MFNPHYDGVRNVVPIKWKSVGTNVVQDQNIFYVLQ